VKLCMVVVRINWGHSIVIIFDGGSLRKYCTQPPPLIHLLEHVWTRVSFERFPSSVHLCSVEVFLPELDPLQSPCRSWLFHFIAVNDILLPVNEVWYICRSCGRCHRYQLGALNTYSSQCRWCLSYGFVPSLPAKLLYLLLANFSFSLLPSLASSTDNTFLRYASLFSQFLCCPLLLLIASVICAAFES